jgi:UDP-GlcNAc:undecaprenyl-phosphate GlcNAc-1-phosphate transferase
MLESLAELYGRYPEPWRIFLPVLLIANVCTAGLYALARGFGRGKGGRLGRWSWLPAVRPRDVHTAARPRVGGLAMWLTVTAAFLAITSHPDTARLLRFEPSASWGTDTALWGILAGMLVILLFGLWDDLASLSPGKQLAGQLLAAGCLVAAGVGVSYIRLPNDSIIYLDRVAVTLPAFLGGATVWVWSALFTVAWVLVMINVLNFFDGLDGLAGTIAVTAAVILFFVSMRGGFLATATLSLITAGAASGFLPWNWHPSKLFMGTVGSQLLGFLLAVIAIISGGKVATAVLVLGIPIFDAAVVILRRLLAGQSPFQADQRHLHHRLLKAGLSVPAVVLLLNGVALVFGVLAVQTQDSAMKGWLTLLVAASMGIFIALTYYWERQVGRSIPSREAVH